MDQDFIVDHGHLEEKKNDINTFCLEKYLIWSFETNMVFLVSCHVVLLTDMLEP